MPVRVGREPSILLFTPADCIGIQWLCLSTFLLDVNMYYMAYSLYGMGRRIFRDVRRMVGKPL